MSIRPKKSLGQHFLKDDNIITKIADAVPAEATERVIEIGAGTGALTEALLERGDDIVAGELDERAVALLNEKLGDLRVHHESVLDSDWEQHYACKSNTQVVVNPLYYKHYLT